MENEILNVLHVDDETTPLEEIETLLQKPVSGVQLRLESFANPASFVERIKRKPAPRIVLLDIDLKTPHYSGLDLAKQCRRKLPDVTIVLLTNYDSPKMVLSSMDAGADEYFQKLSIASDFPQVLLDVHKRAQMKRGLAESETENSKYYRTPPELVGGTLRDLSRKIPLLLKTNSQVMQIEGEPGTGKRLCTQMIEALQPKHIPFFRIDCSEYSPSQLEIELFGHKKGGVAGARTDKEGVFEKANGGVVVIEEISNLTHSAQSSLVNLLESQTTRRTGEFRRRPTQVKLVCTSNVALESLCEQKLIIPELFDYLKCFRISIPPLRVRPIEERVELIRYFVSKLEGGKYSVDQPALELLLKHDWSNGNLRELRTVLRSMTVLQYGNRITALSIPQDILNQVRKSVIDSSSTIGLDDRTGPHKVHYVTLPIQSDRSMSYDYYCDLLFLELIKTSSKVIEENGDSVSFSKLAHTLKLSRPTIMRKMTGLLKSKLVTKREISAWKG